MLSVTVQTVYKFQLRLAPIFHDCTSNNNYNHVNCHYHTGRTAMDETTRIRIYIDGEEEASIDFLLFLGHGIGSDQKTEAPNTPWNTKRLGHDANGAIYNTYQIPFSTSFRVTATHPTDGEFWYIIRGVEGMPVVVGNLELPFCNTRLRLHKNVDIIVGPYQFYTIADVSSTAGMLYQVTLSATSSDYEFLEACLRAKIDGSNTTTWLSSGTEDLFLSGYYFNSGLYHGDDSGLTYKNDPGTMSAYKFFENDPVLFSKSFELIWRCGDTVDVNMQGCPSDWPPPRPGETQSKHSNRLYNPRDSVVTTYVWVYEYTM